MNKKGQVTIFIIIGIVLLLSAGLTFYFVRIAEEGEEEVELIATLVPVEFTQVKDYVEDCIKIIAIDALREFGEHGGYTSMSEDDFNFNINDPTESDAISISPASFSPIPYWWYLVSPNNCLNCQVFSAAPVGDLERILDRYVNSNLLSCINDFEPLKEQNFVFENIGEIDTNSIIAANDVIFGVNYPFGVSKGASTTEIENFVIRIELDLGEILELALGISVNQVNGQYLEDILLHLISIYSGKDVDKLPPTILVDNSPLIIRWSENLVREKLKEILSTNIHFIDVDRTKDANKINDPVYNIFFLDILGKDYDLGVDFNYYSDWQIYLDIIPSHGDILEPTSDIQTFEPTPFPPFRINTYQFYYDVSFPVLVTLTDEKDTVKGLFGDQGYKFYFALEGNIRDNINLRDWMNGEGIISIDPSEIEVTVAGNPQLPNPSLFCSPTQRTSGEYIIKVYDNDDNTDLEGVSITYGCGTHISCPIGTTELDEVSGEFLYKGRLPVCDGGYIYLRKEGYVGKTLPFTAEFNPADPEIPILIDPLATKQVSVKKYIMTTPNQPTLPPPSILDGVNDMVTINIKNLGDPSLDQFVLFDGSNPFAASTQNIDLIPGTYEVTINYFSKIGYTIPKHCERLCVDDDFINLITGTCDDWIYEPNEQDVPNEGTNVPPGNIEVIPAMLGGAILNQDTGGYWQVDQADLQSSDEIEFRFIQVPTPTCIDDASARGTECLLPGGVCVGIDQLGKTEVYTIDYRHPYLDPQWI